MTICRFEKEQDQREVGNSLKTLRSSVTGILDSERPKVVLTILGSPDKYEVSTLIQVK